MNENNKFFIYVNGHPVAVTEEIYREYYRMGRRERYLEERDAANGTVMYSGLDTDETLGEEMIPDTGAKSVEQTVIDGMMTDMLHEALDILTEDERNLINALFYEGHSEREYAAMLRISKTALHARKVKVLALLRKYLEP